MPSGRMSRHVPLGRRGGATRVWSSSASFSGGGGGGGGGAVIGGPPKLGTSIIAEPGIADAETAAGDTATTGGGVVSAGMLRTGVAVAGGGGGGFPGGGGGGGGGGAAGSERAVGAEGGSAVTSGTGTIGDPAAASRAPQLPQKVAPTRVGAPHEVQFISESDASLNGTLDDHRVPISQDAFDVNAAERPLPRFDPSR